MHKYNIERISRSSSGDRLLISVLLPDGKRESISISVSAYRELGIEKGEISGELYDRIAEASLNDDAMRRGLRVLSYGANSPKRLADKLVRSGVSRERAMATARELEDRGYINEESDARRLAESLVRRGWGERRILSSIRAKGYSAEAVESVAISLRDVDFVENCADVVRKKFKTLPEDRASMQKTVAKLVNLGYNVNDAKRALARVIGERKNNEI